MKKGDKRGLSGVVTTLIIILLSLVAVVTIWVVIRNIVESGSEQIQLGQYTVDLDLQKAVSIPAGTQVTVTRKPGQGAMSGLKFIVSDGVNSYIYDQKDITLNELETKTFTINHTGPIKSVSVAPLIKTGTTDTAQNVVDDMKFSSYEAAKGMNGLVSWWRLEGNANDEMGLNNGAFSVLYPSPPLVNGNFGKAYRFSIVAEHMIRIPDSSSLRLENSNMTIITWVNKTSSPPSIDPIISKGDVRNHAEPGFFVGTTYANSSRFFLSFGTPSFNVQSTYNLSSKKWAQLAFSQTVNAPSRTLIFYHNGAIVYQSSSGSVTTTNSTGYDLLIGADNDVDKVDYGSSPYQTLTGIIDEVMIFNRTLSADEIKALYNLDLNDK